VSPATALAVLSLGVFLALFAVPNDADQGVSQRIFYLHVPSALTAYGCFLVGGYKAFRLLSTRRPQFELESHTAVHLGLVFSVIALTTGSVWAKASWGVWWSWQENQLVLFLILFLFYSAYFMLRYSLPPGRSRANISAVYAVFGLVLIPISFLAVRLAERFIHPVVFSRHGPQMELSMFVAFSVCLAGVAALAVALYSIELAGRRAARELAELAERA
jgi:heme exporter protein C